MRRRRSSKSNLNRMEAMHSRLTKMKVLEIFPLCLCQRHGDWKMIIIFRQTWSTNPQTQGKTVETRAQAVLPASKITWWRPVLTLSLNLPCCGACSGTCRSSRDPSETGSSPSFLAFASWSAVVHSGGTLQMKSKAQLQDVQSFHLNGKGWGLSILSS